MSNLLNTHELLMEAMRTESSKVNSVREDDVEAGFENMWAELPELSAPLVYTEDAVPIFGIEGAIVVEYDSLSKYMESSNIKDVVEAITKLKEHYNLDDLSIVVESYDTAYKVFKEAIEISSKSLDKSGLNRIKTSANLIKGIKERGIKVFRKKGLEKGK